MVVSACIHGIDKDRFLVIPIIVANLSVSTINGISRVICVHPIIYVLITIIVLIEFLP